MSKSLSQLVSLIKLSLARRKLVAKIPYSNLNFNLLKILYYEGYIRGFRVSNSSFDLQNPSDKIQGIKAQSKTVNKTPTKIFVFLKLNYFKSGILDLAYFSPRNKHSYLTYKKLIRFYGLKNFGIVSTNSGLLTLEQCFLHKKGEH